MQTKPTETSPSNVLEGQGQVRQRLRAFDWSASPLGLPHAWPHPLRWQLQVLLDNPQPCALWWGPAQVAFYNDAFAGLLGPHCHPATLAMPADQAGTPLWRFIGGQVQQVLAGGAAIWRERVPIPRADERPTWWTYAISPLRDGAVIHGALLGCTDVTGIHLGAQDAREAYHTVINAMDEGFAVVELLYDDAGQAVDYRWLEVNAAYMAHTGLRDVVGQRALERLPGINTTLLQAFDRIAKAGRTERFTIWSEPLRRWLEQCAVQVGRPGENRVGVLVRDVSAQRQLIEALEETRQVALDAARRVEAERQQLAAVLQAVPVPVYTADAQGHGVPVNLPAAHEWARLPGQGPDQWQGWWPDGTPRAGQPLAPQEWPLVRALAGEPSSGVRVELPGNAPGEPRRTLLISAAPVRGRDGAVTGAVATSMDVTEAVRAQHALEDADRRKDQFLAMLVHELRNPLAPIRTAAELLLREQLPPESIQRCAAIISRQVGHLAALVNDLTDISRVRQGTVELNRHEVDVQHVVIDALEQVRQLMETRGHRLRVRPAARPVRLHADGERLVQVLANLLTNAARYTPDGGEVTLTLEALACGVRITVQDTGVGMAPEFIPQAFEMFTQARRSSDREQGGLGLGLALVRKLVELHGGTVQASSPGEGLGSCFTVTLPCEVASQGPVARPEAWAEPSRPLERRKVLVVDDDEDTARSLGMMVESFGYHALVAYASDEALALAQREQARACIVDIGLPQMDGNQLAARLREMPGYDEACLIAVSGLPGDWQQGASRAGFHHCLAKPVDSPTLHRMLADCPTPGDAGPQSTP